MAITIISNASFICLVYTTFILSIYTTNCSPILGRRLSEDYEHPSVQKEAPLAFLNRIYQRPTVAQVQFQEFQHEDIPFTEGQEAPVLDQKLFSTLNWSKRDVRRHDPIDKRMLCFFHAVNCFG